MPYGWHEHYCDTCQHSYDCTEYECNLAPVAMCLDCWEESYEAFQDEQEAVSTMSREKASAGTFRDKDNEGSAEEAGESDPVRERAVSW